MAERAARIDAFLARAGWADASRVPLAGDASARSYMRLTRDGDRAILMDAPPATCGPQTAFFQIGDRLSQAGLSVPACLARDDDLGLFLLEDLGDLVLARLIAHEPQHELSLYAAATDALVHLQRNVGIDGLPRYGPDEMATAIRPAWQFHVGGGEPSRRWLDLEDHLRALLHAHDAGPVAVHRDYHAENLLWLPDRVGIKRLGMLDFQDAVAGHPAYDLASLLQDARRDLAPGIEDDMIRRFVRAVGGTEDRFRAAYALQAIQRHLRILGIFSRLAAQRGKPGYLALMPRVWRDLQRDLAHPVAAPLKPLIRDLVPPPQGAA
ncbi:phosphotransferase [Maribius pontilimi]|uniref:Phosphotransferase n=1 Tax=Palleronia pontilimi TaxID=1964209 RepID=A0A934IF91_9RHOB|nr:phosphotransferase [Palleronia pontilimi]MBJ3761525.1 phosphotransferase [Palleronia pontilimi]